MLRLAGRMAEDSVALARNMPMRLRHVDVRETFVSCRSCYDVVVHKTVDLIGFVLRKRFQLSNSFCAEHSGEDWVAVADGAPEFFFVRAATE